MSRDMLRNTTLERHGGNRQRHLAGGKSQSYTDISTQISGHSAVKWDIDFTTKATDRPSKMQYTERSTLDYGFLRKLLGLSASMSTRKKSRNEGFVSDELKEAVMKLRQEVKDLKLEIKDENWLKTLEDLGDLNDMDRDFLEALYMLRNAYKRGVFSSTQNINDIDIGLILEGQPSSQLRERNNFATLTNQDRERSHSPLSSRRSFSSDYSSDVESTTSSIMIKKRPAQPRIDLSSASFNDLAAKEVELLPLKLQDPVPFSEKHVAPLKVSRDQQSYSNRIPDRPDSAGSSTSYLNLVEENAGLKCLSGDNADVHSSMQKSTQKTACSEYSSLNSKPNSTKIYGEFRSKSPTSKLLQPIFHYPMSEDMFKVLEGIRAEISPKLSRLERLENENKLLAVLQVKLAVLQEEKRQLLNTLKQKRSSRQSMSSNHSSKTSSPLSSPVSFQSEADEVFVIRPHPHRAKLSKSVQTEKIEQDLCPYCHGVIVHSSFEIADRSNRKTENGNSILSQNKVSGDARIAEQIVTKADAHLLNAGCDVEPYKSDRMQSHADVDGTVAHRDSRDASTETDIKEARDCGVGNDAIGQCSANASTQCMVESSEAYSQHDSISYENKSVLAGCSCSHYEDIGVQCQPEIRSVSFGDGVVEKVCVDKGTQQTVLVSSKEIACHPPTSEKGSMCGHCLEDRIIVGCQTRIPSADFACGDGVAVIESVNKTCQAVVNHTSIRLSPIEWERNDFNIQCNLDQKQCHTIGLGDCAIDDILCDKCLNSNLVSIGVGAYNTGNQRVDYAASDLCRVDDKLCECFKPDTCETGAGDLPIDYETCDSCRNRAFETVACSDDRVDKFLCDSCEGRQLESRGCGESDVNFILCEKCALKPAVKDIGIGSDNADVFDVVCDSCQKPVDVSGYVNVSIVDRDTEDLSSVAMRNAPIKDRNAAGGENIEDRKRLMSGSSETEFCEEVYNIMANSTMYDNGELKPVVCNYCGNKVDVNDTEMDSALNEMRNNLGSYRRNGIGTSLRTVENLAEFVDEEDGGNVDDVSDESGEDGEPNDSVKNDIVESCKLLQQHLSGEKPMKQPLMLKHLANIEALWFQTVKKKRANAAVVKSYIDLFQSRIPQLLETIINLMDQDGNTALHYALTYKNTGVVSILLDSQECSIDLFNKAGYSCIMLAALAGFESKTDKYVMQRLIRAGDINAKNKETGQTPLMLAVSRGHAGMADLLLDSGADVNESDNDGSTALMCACEVGSMPLVKTLLSNPECDATKEDHDGSTALSIAMDAKRRDLALLIYGSLNFDARGRIKLTPSKQSLLGLGTRRSPSPAVGKL